MMVRLPSEISQKKLSYKRNWGYSGLADPANTTLASAVPVDRDDAHHSQAKWQEMVAAWEQCKVRLGSPNDGNTHSERPVAKQPKWWMLFFSNAAA